MAPQKAAARLGTLRRWREAGHAVVTTAEHPASLEDSRGPHHGPPAGLVPLVVGALGVVYGDLGTSPLYSIREAFVGQSHRLAVDRVNVLGAVSIIVWTLVIIIAVKYVLLVLRADNRGEGGILALTAMVAPDAVGPTQRAGASWLLLLGLFGTALLFGDGMITPAISVLSAVEGIEVVAPALDSLVIPISVGILIALFAIQRFGTGTVGRLFGPIMVVWFVTMAVLGTANLVRAPEILQAVNPANAVRYFTTNTFKAFLSMGSLFLVVTGGEALYADMGHFGRSPIRSGWYLIVMPSLLLTYFGIGALLIRKPEAIESPFFLLAPDALQLPLVVLATFATVIASQALISGVFTLTQQAVQLGYAPLTRIVFTSRTAKGQIFVPVVNWALMIACVGLVIGFGTSARLAAAFGLSVTGTMFITTILFAVYARRTWQWSLWLLVPLIGVILLVEGAFLLANAFKIPHGGWFPLAVGIVIITQLTTWKTGRALVAARIRRHRPPLAEFAEQLGSRPDIVRVPGVAVFLYSLRGLTPPSMTALIGASHALHESVYVVSIRSAEVPVVDADDRVDVTELDHGVHEVALCYGFMEQTCVADDLARHLGLASESTDYFLGRETVRSTKHPGMARWREVLFTFMARNASDVATYFQIPAERVIEIGRRVEI
jgi:KUP system potassium uptake protein